MEFNQLMITENGLSVEEQRFKLLHNEILFCGNTASEYAIKMANDLKEMRDSKSYKVAGFETFGDYTEKALGLKERQAYNYIQVIEKLPSNFLHSNAKIGITKLLMLSSVSEEKREEIVETVDVESVTVKELKEKIAEQEDKIKQLSLDLTEKATSIANVTKLANEKTTEFVALKSSIDSKVSQAVAKEKAKNDSLNLKINELEAKIDELKEKPALDTTEIERLKKELEEKESELRRKEKEIVISSDSTLLEFKIEFNNFQSQVDKILSILNTMNFEIRANCYKAIKKVLEVFYE